MSNQESAAERLARMKAQQEAAKKGQGNKEIVEQLAHESTGEPDFAELAAKLQARNEKEKSSLLDGAVKYTIYVDEDIAAAFNALCLKRGDQRRFINQALAEFVKKKSKELGI